ncbi:cadmium-translocating P-type ATPase [bacterium]|nr:cadmium-translocating P-type ATPase [bacterium]
MPESLTFHVQGMDCAEEIAILKREVAPLVGDDERLSFDLLNGTMTVQPTGDNGAAIEKQIVRAVGKTGMKAMRDVPSCCADGVCEVHGSFWQRRGRTLLVIASGVLVAVGFLLHGILEGWSAAVGAEESKAPLPAVIAYAFAVAAGIWHILPKAWYAVNRIRPDMNLLMTIAVAGAIGIGEWFEAGTVTFLFAISLMLEAWSVGRARREVEALMELAPERARWREKAGGEWFETPVEEVPVGAVVRVRAGEKIPLDGEVTNGAGYVNEAAVTGESNPVSKLAGSNVFAGTLNSESTLEIRVTKAASDSTIARVLQLVREARSQKAPSEQFVERFARWYTPAMLGIAALVAVVPPLLGGGWAHWFYTALVVLVIGCPCALVISTPVSIVAGLASSARAGVLIKGGRFLEAPAHLKVIAFDKTGTLTRGEPQVTAVYLVDGTSETDLLRYAASVETHANHPLAKAILADASVRGIDPSDVADVKTLSGRGITGMLGRHSIYVGRPDEAQQDERIMQVLEEIRSDGATAVEVRIDERIAGYLAIADQPRDEAREVVEALRRLGIEKTVMLTGDTGSAARRIASAMGIDDVRAELLPEQKLLEVQRLGAEGRGVAMVGDGVNDAPALAAAPLSIAMGAAGTDVAIETADIALMKDDLTRLPWLLRHSRRTVRTIHVNIGFALALKAAVFLLASMGVATLWMAIAADMGASLLVVANSLRLLRIGS